MWVLDVIHATTNALETSFYLITGEWSIGRKKCHFNFHEDSSISRTHAVIRVGAFSTEQLRDPSTRPALVLVDKNSRFGSFVNQEQCFGERALRHGDQVTFGAKRTVLRVRYQVFVLVASRIHKTNRARVNDTCQRIGMHLIPSESKDATHCIMDPGRIVATVKVLWALVNNQPVVTTQWIYAILERKSLSEPLPRCEQFLPMDENLPSVASNYLPNPMRKTLFHRHVIVFLTPQSMEELITAMDGIAIAAHKDGEHDDLMLREIEQHASSRQVLIVEPTQGSGFSSGATSSDARDPSGSTCNASVERRVDLFRSMGAPFTSIQELAASVIFVKTPLAPSSECSFASSLAGHNSISAPMMSFPEHLSLRAPNNDDDEEEDSSSDHGGKKEERDDTSKVPETSSHVHHDDLSSTPRPPPLVGQRNRVAPSPSESIVDESLAASSFQIKDEPTPPPVRVEVPVKMERQVANRPKSKPFQVPALRKLEDSPVSSPRPNRSVQRRDHDDEERRHSSSFVTTGQWVSSRDLVPRPMKAQDGDGFDTKGALDEETVRPRVVTCRLVVKKRTAKDAQLSSSSSDSEFVNFKRFKKGNGYATRSHASLFPKQTVISVTVDNAERESIHQNLQVLEEQERIAEELFAMAENRAATRKRL